MSQETTLKYVTVPELESSLANHLVMAAIVETRKTKNLNNLLLIIEKYIKIANSSIMVEALLLKDSLQNNESLEEKLEN